MIFWGVPRLEFRDSILIYFANTQDHVDHLKKVLRKILEHHLYTKISKCEILNTSLDILNKEEVT